MQTQHRFHCQCGWAFYYEKPGQAKCPQCASVVSLPPPRESAQGPTFSGIPGSLITARAAICEGCHFLTGRGCAHYIRPCTVKELWKDQVDPPTNCPRKSQFDE